MANLFEELVQREQEGHPIRVGVIGAGQMGTGMIAQISTIPGMCVTGICDIVAERAEEAKRIYLAGSQDPHNIITSTDYAEVIRAKDVDVIVEATGITEIGARVSMATLLAKKHLVLLNVEVDITIGVLMKQLFDAAGLVYTGSDGDEPAATFSLFNFARAMGMEVLVAGKGKNNKLKPYANPDTARQEAEDRGMNPHMLAAFQDGTKTMAEMTLLSNATGFVPDMEGMHGIAGDLDETVKQFDLVRNGGVLSNFGVVDYVDGIAPGVFVIVKGQNEQVAAEMNYMLKKGERDHHILYRPFHLGSLETPLTIARAVLHGQAAIVPMAKPVSEAVAVAKKDIAEGEPIDGIGGFCVRGRIETHEMQQQERHIPIGLLVGNAVAKRNIAKDSVLTEEDVELDQSTQVYRLRSLQDSLIG